ncbi:polyphosphate--glucose phosphotransferase [Corynebacterium suicordis]|nr:ROK family protein [Corynebacterium suicordis]MDR6277534.1 polyphosphate glucokinase [Corynebacterium suicordis]
MTQPGMTQHTTNNTHDDLAFGVDIGGSGVKGALVNVRTGELVSERQKIKTPQPSTPDAVAEVVRQLVDAEHWDGPVGITVPSVVREQVALTAANIDPLWIGTHVQDLFQGHLGAREITVLNDADAAGLAEVRFGDPTARTGAVMMLTFGTGIGTALLIDGELYPNTELGHLPFGSTTAEKYASSKVREKENLSYADWAQRVDEVMHAYSKLFNPLTFVVGGGISRDADRWVPLLTVEQDVVPAQLRNEAGIIGAALAVKENTKP